MGIKNSELAWQLRSNTLCLMDGRIELYMPMLQSATPAVLAMVQERCNEINRVIAEWESPPTSIDEITSYFNRL